MWWQPSRRDRLNIQAARCFAALTVCLSFVLSQCKLCWGSLSALPIEYVSSSTAPRTSNCRSKLGAIPIHDSIHSVYRSMAQCRPQSATFPDALWRDNTHLTSLYLGKMNTTTRIIYCVTKSDYLRTPHNNVYLPYLCLGIIQFSSQTRVLFNYVCTLCLHSHSSVKGKRNHNIMLLLLCQFPRKRIGQHPSLALCSDAGHILAHIA